MQGCEQHMLMQALGCQPEALSGDTAAYSAQEVGYLPDMPE